MDAVKGNYLNLCISIPIRKGQSIISGIINRCSLFVTLACNIKICAVTLAMYLSVAKERSLCPRLPENAQSNQGRVRQYEVRG